MAFPGSEKSVWRVVLRMISLWGSVFGIIAIAAGSPFPDSAFWYYLMLGLCAFWSLIVLIIMAFKCVPHPGFMIAFDLLLTAASVFICVIAGFGTSVYGHYDDYEYDRLVYEQRARCIAALVFSILVAADHFSLFVIACVDVDNRRQTAFMKAPHDEFTYV
ncbi:hypothetical protein N7468_003202 [Penicillium chermesinum]|uniref:MARVEL domain-containing protein n=1 Tax=Penicillium chermesinum TaxID=63820 RepID=A0A9W9TS06_9EURO|nr:uncharacterized protein N7468_003202 [Penicillium chermesinum]KAJ5238583.1 hypothetical protein N7468_003202 [Penicillium chermesinum]KAJ6164234.1 hypothetical protein N7470_002906 [Penicillium chermesinum]